MTVYCNGKCKVDLEKKNLALNLEENVEEDISVLLNFTSIYFFSCSYPYILISNNKILLEARSNGIQKLACFLKTYFLDVSFKKSSVIWYFYM